VAAVVSTNWVQIAYCTSHVFPQNDRFVAVLHGDDLGLHIRNRLTRQIYSSRLQIVERVEQYSQKLKKTFAPLTLRHFGAFLSCCSAVSESDVGGQLVLLSSLAQLQNLDSCPSVSACKWHSVQKHLPLSSSCSLAFYLHRQCYRFKFILSQHMT